MNYGYDPGYTYYGDMGGEIVAAFYMLYFLVAAAVGLGTYILQSYSMYTIAKRRGIHHAWLAWIPVGDIWMLGCISDQYQYVSKGRVRNKRKTMMVLQILSVVLVVILFVLFVGIILQTANGFYNDMYIGYGFPEELLGSVMAAAGGMLIVGLVMSGISIAMTVIRYMALYDLYRSCEPDNAVIYLVVGIFVAITQPVFMFLCRKKDDGMPPRKEEVEYEIVYE